MDTVILQGKTREKTGSGPSKQSRRAGNIPANLYGHGMTPVSFEVAEKPLYKVLHGEHGTNAVIELDLDTKLKEKTCRVKEIQQNPVTDKIEHIDFVVISLTEKVEVNVPLSLKSAEECKGAKAGGVLDIVHHELTVECLPTNIPDHIYADVAELEIGGLIHVKDLDFPEGVVCNLDPEETVVAVHAPRVEEEAPAGEEEGAEGDAAAEPEVIEKGKKTEEEGEPSES